MFFHRIVIRQMSISRAEFCSSRGISLPTHGLLTENDMDVSLTPLGRRRIALIQNEGVIASSFVGRQWRWALLVEWLEQTGSMYRVERFSPVC
jgi:hypothetical protein